MKNLMMITLLSLAPVLAQAQAQDNVAIRCRPTLSYQGDATEVIVERSNNGLAKATILRGRSGQQGYVVEKNETADLRYEKYSNQEGAQYGFLLEVDKNEKKASLRAEFKGNLDKKVSVDYSVLSCQFSEFTHK
ncbi:MAG TPA: hypothetical protein VN132_07870 [Bdellovibrio sp.]|nr:hypothetical protein [Bdellovibrio sp.]